MPSPDAVVVTAVVGTAVVVTGVILTTVTDRPDSDGLLLFLIVPPTAPPTTAPMTMRTATTMAMMPLRLRQKDVWEVGAAGVDPAEPSFSPEPASAVTGAKGTETGCGRVVSGGGGPRKEGARGVWLGRLTL